MSYHSIIIALLLVVLGGCATYRDTSPARLQTLPQHFEEFDMKMAWEYKTSEGSTVVDGVVKNIRYYEMDDLEVWVVSLDDKGREINRAVDYVYKLKENEFGQFTVKIPQVASGSRLRFMYIYKGQDGGGDAGDATPWRNSFETVVP
jgi:DNA-binding protein